MPDKYQSYMRAKMRATAESRGRDPRIAEAMVDSRIYIEGVNDSGKVLTFTTSEAIKNKYCDGEVQTLNELFKIEKLDEINAVRFQPTWIDNVLGFLLNPAVSGILILIMLGGLYYEMQAPGIGFPLAAAVIAAVLYFAPHYIEGLAAHWEILIFIAGIILIGLEIFVFPGFGVTGISGIILVVISLALSLLNNVGFDFTFTPTISILQSFATVITAMVIGIFFFIFTGKGIMHSTVFKKMVLVDSQQSDHGFNAALSYQLCGCWISTHLAPRQPCDRPMFAPMLGWSIASVCTALAALILIVRAIRQRRMRPWWIALSLIVLSLCFATVVFMNMGKIAYSRLRGWLAPRDGIATYTALFGTDAESCVQVVHHRDQLIPKIDIAVKFRVRTCPLEMERILAQLEYTSTIS